MRKALIKFSGVIACLALFVTKMNVNTACTFLIHQPKLPKGAEKLRKF
ncbi:cyclic lactone autoinducer peptide [Lutispora thermophila]|uniref:Cyclic lactone autoinducer peptide n=1 Tax=Lutispora thermophila DSM 19022 TaxID=1122184 RepID=A0A1M6DLV5_9FIRM|nr:cyclic lactone autoinducer peptide [Lutispora thermophila]SHI74133.1 cyclic lactone autoinducer peptide [Lutispora thermophila DSM 19022]